MPYRGGHHAALEIAMSTVADKSSPGATNDATGRYMCSLDCQRYHA